MISLAIGAAFFIAVVGWLLVELDDARKDLAQARMERDAFEQLAQQNAKAQPRLPNGRFKGKAK